VPFSLCVAGVFLTGALLEKKQAVISMLVYILLGAAGAPVFSGFSGGLSNLFGPTGGYILAYPLMVFVIAFIAEKLKKSIVSYAFGMLGALVICYTVGTLWLAVVAKMSFESALFAGVVPFVIFDIIKIALSSFVSFGANRALSKIYK
jgi:biotin transport system substrate-specific component